VTAKLSDGKFGVLRQLPVSPGAGDGHNMQHSKVCLVKLNVNHLLNVLSAKICYVPVFWFGVWRSQGLADVQFSLKLNKYDNMYALFTVIFTFYCHSRHKGRTA
jgi:hypothetical protein